MQRRALGMFASCWLVGCGSSAGGLSQSTVDAGTAGNDSGTPPSAVSGDGGDAQASTPPIGVTANECVGAADCAERVAAELAALAAPAPSSPSVTSVACTQVSVMGVPSPASGPTCDCASAGWVGPEGLGCYAIGRSGDCLMGDPDFSGCVIGEPETCAAPCADLEQRLATDAARTFQAEVVYTACLAAMCHSVVEIEGRCYADRSYQSGQAYDCALGGEAILAQHLAPEPAPVPTPSESSLYVAGTAGFIKLSAYTGFSGTAQVQSGFSGWAQFYPTLTGDFVRFGTVIDPLEGVDDCGVALPGGMGAGGPTSFLDVASLTLLDQDRSIPFEPSLANNPSVGYYAYGLDLTSLGVEPRYGGSYGVTGGGGGFGNPIAIDGLLLPEALSSPELELASRFERGALRLTWTGRGPVDLALNLSVRPKLADSFNPYQIACLVTDDGEFTIPAEVLEAVPEGFVTATLRRENRGLVAAGSMTLLTIGAVEARHNFALGPKCERPEVVDACARYVTQTQAVHSECGTVETSSAAELCPDYLAEACGGCVEYFDCKAAAVSCQDGMVVIRGGCACP